MNEECVFCKIAKGEIPCYKIYENGSFFSVLDISPAVEGHSLIISKKHFENTLDLPDSLGPEFLDCIKKTALKILERENARGFNVLGNNFEVAGQVVNHFHVHIIPRKKGDGDFKFVKK